MHTTAVYHTLILLFSFLSDWLLEFHNYYTCTGLRFMGLNTLRHLLQNYFENIAS